MRTTLILKDDLIAKAAEFSGIKEKTALVHAGLEALISKQARERLVAMGGCSPLAKPVRRRKAGGGKRASKP